MGGILPTQDIEQVYYLGSFDPIEQVPPEFYRVTVRGQASFISRMRFGSGWVRSELIDSLNTRVDFGDQGFVQIRRSAGVPPKGGSTVLPDERRGSDPPSNSAPADDSGKEEGKSESPNKDEPSSDANASSTTANSPADEVGEGGNSSGAPSGSSGAVLVRSTDTANLQAGRRYVLFGPEGQRPVPHEHRLVIVMGSSPEAFFSAIDKALGQVSSVQRIRDSALSSRELFEQYVEVTHLVDRLQELEQEAARIGASK